MFCVDVIQHLNYYFVFASLQKKSLITSLNSFLMSALDQISKEKHSYL